MTGAEVYGDCLCRCQVC